MVDKKEGEFVTSSAQAHFRAHFAAFHAVVSDGECAGTFYQVLQRPRGFSGMTVSDHQSCQIVLNNHRSYRFCIFERRFIIDPARL